MGCWGKGHRAVERLRGGKTFAFAILFVSFFSSAVWVLLVKQSLSEGGTPHANFFVEFAKIVESLTHSVEFLFLNLSVCVLIFFDHCHCVCFYTFVRTKCTAEMLLHLPGLFLFFFQPPSKRNG